MENTVLKLRDLLLRHPKHYLETISCQFSIPLEILDYFEDTLIWKTDNDTLHTQGISSNSFIDWTGELLVKYRNRLDWSAVSLSIIGRSIWNETILNEFESEIDWSNLSLNSSIPWSAELLKKYESFRHRFSINELAMYQKAPWSNHFDLKYDNLDLRLENMVKHLFILEKDIDWDTIEINYCELLSREQMHFLVREYFKLYPN
jgi:hypothetical protein